MSRLLGFGIEPLSTVMDSPKCKSFTVLGNQETLERIVRELGPCSVAVTMDALTCVLEDPVPLESVRAVGGVPCKTPLLVAWWAEVYRPDYLTPRDADRYMWEQAKLKNPCKHNYVEVTEGFVRRMKTEHRAPYLRVTLALEYGTVTVSGPNPDVWDRVERGQADTVTIECATVPFMRQTQLPF